MAKGKYSISTRYFQPEVKSQLITLQEASRNALYISHYISLGLPSCISYMFNELTALNAYWLLYGADRTRTDTLSSWKYVQKLAVLMVNGRRNSIICSA